MSCWKPAVAITPITVVKVVVVLVASAPPFKTGAILAGVTERSGDFMGDVIGESLMTIALLMSPESVALKTWLVLGEKNERKKRWRSTRRCS